MAEMSNMAAYVNRHLCVAGVRKKRRLCAVATERVSKEFCFVRFVTKTLFLRFVNSCLVQTAMNLRCAMTGADFCSFVKLQLFS